MRSDLRDVDRQPVVAVRRLLAFSGAVATGQARQTGDRQHAQRAPPSSCGVRLRHVPWVLVHADAPLEIAIRGFNGQTKGPPRILKQNRAAVPAVFG